MLNVIITISFWHFQCFKGTIKKTYISTWSDLSTSLVDPIISFWWFWSMKVDFKESQIAKVKDYTI